MEMLKEAICIELAKLLLKFNDMQNDKNTKFTEMEQTRRKIEGFVAQLEKIEQNEKAVA